MRILLLCSAFNGPTYAARLAVARDYPTVPAAKRARRVADERHKPLRVYRRAEVVEMSAGILDDRHGFTHARSSFPTAAGRPRSTAGTR